MEFRNVESVAIIGAGVAGLATAKTLLASGLSCTIFERAERLGGVWADGYSNFGVQVQKELYEFPDWPLPDDTPNFTPGPIFQKYLEAYVDQFGVRPCLRLGAKIVGLRRFVQLWPHPRSYDSGYLTIESRIARASLVGSRRHRRVEAAD